MVGTIGNAVSSSATRVLQTDSLPAQAQMNIFKKALALEAQIDLALVAQIASGQANSGGGVDLLA
jgi:hypothetical protein